MSRGKCQAMTKGRLKNRRIFLRYYLMEDRYTVVFRSLKRDWNNKRHAEDMAVSLTRETIALFLNMFLSMEDDREGSNYKLKIERKEEGSL